MSSISNHPYVKVMRYWFRRFREHPNAVPFLITKALEVLTFKLSKDNMKSKEVSEEILESSRQVKSLPKTPRVSVVVPAYIRNELELRQLKRLVGRLSRQVYPTDIVVVDDHSPIRYSLSHIVLLQRSRKNGGPASARNKGIEVALSLGSDIIAFTDSDCIPAKDWSRSFVQKFKNDPTCHILSGLTMSHDRNWFGTYHDMNGTLNGRRFTGSELLLYGPTCNLAIANEVAQQLRFNPLFNIAAGEDIEFCIRALRMGFNIKHCRDAVVRHDFRYLWINPIGNLVKFIRQFQKYSKGETILLGEVPNYYSFLERTEEINSI